MKGMIPQPPSDSSAKALDACRGVNLQPGDVEQAIQEMGQRGVIIA